ncbi:MAG: zinc-dependent peptidase [Actinobacteria bacterium]|nr:zinc-dependent peptidase [Actinomycetota bacterium]
MRHGRGLADWDRATSRLPWWGSLPPADRDRLTTLTTGFLRHKTFEGTKGFEPTGEMCSVVAAQACLLVLGLDLDWYRDVTSVVLAPHTVTRTRPTVLDGGLASDDPVHLGGESMLHGPVMIVWDEVLHHLRHPAWGRNVVFHEFAHKLDMRDGAATGEPPMAPALAAEWRRVMEPLLQALRDTGDRVLDTYGATSPAELMAVCTEAFFVQPGRLRETHPDVYGLFREFYRQDPAER